jgi:hypothetical protein
MWEVFGFDYVEFKMSVQVEWEIKYVRLDLIWKGLE